MRVAVYHSNSDVRVEERAVPAIGPGELLLRVRASGICGSDVMEWYRLPRAPLVLGHEVAGTVEQVGAGVSAFAPGDRVVATHHVPCDECRYCRSDRHSACDTLRTTSFDPGGFAEFVRVPALQVEKGTLALPSSVSFEAGSFVEPLACVVRGQRLAGVRRGDRVAVLGSGISGILQIQLARVTGAETIVATDVDASRVDAALRFGADRAVLVSDDGVDAILAANDGQRFDRVLVCAAALGAMSQALRIVDRGGSVLIFAPPLPGQELAVPINDLWRMGVSIVHSYAGPPAEMREALALIESGRVDVSSMISHRFGLGETVEGFRLMSRPGASLKIIVDPGI